MKNISFLALLLFVAFSASAQDRFDGSSSSDWNVAANWVDNSVPTSTDDVILDPADYALGNAPVISSTPTAQCRDLIINSGAILTMNTNRNLTCARNLKIVSGGKFQMNNIGTTSFNSTSASGLVTVGGSIYNFGTLRVRRVTMNTANSVINGNGRFLIYYLLLNQNVTCKGGLDSIGNLTVDNGRNCTIDSGYVQLALLTDNNGADSYQPSLVFNNGTSKLTLGSTASRVPELRYSGYNYDTDANYDRLPLTATQFICGQGTMWYNATNGDQAVNSNTTYFNLKVSVNQGDRCHIGVESVTCIISCATPIVTFNNVTVTGDFSVVCAGGTSGIAAIDDDLIVTGNIDIAANTTLSAIDNVGLGQSGDITVGGNWNNNGSFTRSIRRVTFNGGSTQSVSGSSVTTFYDLTINKTGSGAELTLTQGAVNTGELAFTNTLNITDDRIRLNHRVLRISNSSTAAISRTSGYIISEETTTSGASTLIDGRVIWENTNSFSTYVFPFGSDGTNDYLPLTVTGASGNLGTISAATARWTLLGTISTGFPANYNGSTAVTHVKDYLGVNNSSNIVRRFWSLDKTGTGTANLIFTYADGATNANASGTREANDEVPEGTAAGGTHEPTNGLRGQFWNNATSRWDYPFVGAQSSDAANNTVTVNGTGTFSVWAVSKLASPLPVGLLNFSAVTVGKTVNLNWQTASEYQNSHFDVERSADGINFEKIATVKAVGNSSSLKSYTHTDKTALTGISFYRLKQVDVNGDNSYSKIVSVNLSILRSIQIQPNPASGFIYLGLDYSGEESSLPLKILDINGRLVKSATLLLSDTKVEISDLSPGVYFVELPAAVASSRQRFIKQ